MPWWKQAGLVLALVVTVGVAWAYYVPAAAPVFARLGLPAPVAEGGGEGPGGDFSGGAVGVVAQPVGEGRANGRVAAIGDGRAVRSVAVTPLVAGRIEAIAVGAGERVAPGDLLVELDSEAEEIALARAELDLADAEAALARAQQLRSSGATSDVLAREAELTRDRAALAVREAELALERRRVLAPIGGVVGIIPVDAGQQVTTATEVARIEDRARILVEFRLPERWVGRIQEGDPVEAMALAQPDRPLGGRVHALDNRVDPETRTLRVQAVIENPDDTLRAGMAFRIGAEFAGERYPSVDPLAIQWSSDGAFVWAAREGRAVQVPVRIVQRSEAAVLVAAEFAPGDLVVTEGVQRLSEGAEVELREGTDGAGLGLSRAGRDPSES